MNQLRNVSILKPFNKLAVRVLSKQIRGNVYIREVGSYSLLVTDTGICDAITIELRGQIRESKVDYVYTLQPVTFDCK